MIFGTGRWELLNVGNNRTQIRTPRGVVCFSYSTPVVVYDRKRGMGLKLNKPPSKTSARHIEMWAGGAPKIRATTERVEKWAARILGIES